MLDTAVGFEQTGEQTLTRGASAGKNKRGPENGVAVSSVTFQICADQCFRRYTDNGRRWKGCLRFGDAVRCGEGICKTTIQHAFRVTCRIQSRIIKDSRRDPSTAAEQDNTEDLSSRDTVGKRQMRHPCCRQRQDTVSTET